ncbi:leucine-rich repeat-containing protein 75A [Callorhinchus milii]|uniref:Leucine-rich repeat-containing protein C17orf76-like protein n=1 Tax=Callorhinchus milii TaxID=7868 RepID=V9KQK3_CALMI|nr:leucine-rich repeat-containing protein 75A [Callorhinchus milii]XP_042194810.1 leucine-rich repeat-containing protein 75A [Callorhinchus milii]
MGTKQTKGLVPSEGGESPRRLLGSRRRSGGREKPDFLSAMVLRSSERLGRAGAPPYQRRVSMVQEMATLVRQGRQLQATQLLKSLRQDLGMESTSLDDVLYRYASFRNLVDPITHDLIISLARHIHCPRPEGDAVGATEKVCRQLTYHLSPHSQCRRRGPGRGKPQHCLKAVLSETVGKESVDLSGIFLGGREVERFLMYLEQQGGHMASIELCFTELTDQGFLQLLPSLSRLPHLSHLSLNGNRLTRAVLRPLTDTLKHPHAFPSLAWIDLGNNVDIFSLPQPFLVSLRKRSPKQGSLPTIPETGEGLAGERESLAGEPEVGNGEETEANAVSNQT